MFGIKRKKKLPAALRSRLVQGLLAFVIGGLAMAVLSYGLVTLSGIDIFVTAHLAYFPQPYHAPTHAARAWNDFSAVLGSMLVTILPAALAASAMMVILRELGLKLTWAAARDILWLTVASMVVLVVLSYVVLISIHQEQLSVAGQTALAYFGVLSAGLPFAFSWLWATRDIKFK